LLHVLEVHAGSTPQFAFGLVLPSKVEESKLAAEEELQKMLDADWAADKRIVTATTHGPPFIGILRYAKEHDIDMIIMGTHGRTGLAHTMIGSVAERVVRKAPCPVLTVRPEGHQFVMP
jgi:nucleotide-binding universal stress UspA family protein